MGQERRFERPGRMSAFHPIATAIATCSAVTKGHKRPKCGAAKERLFDHLVGAGFSFGSY